MESINISIISRQSEFVDFINDYLSYISRNSLNRLRLMSSEQLDTYYVLIKGIFVYFKLHLIDVNNLSIEIAFTENLEPEIMTFIEEIEKQIWNKFSPSPIPLGFSNLISDDNYSHLMEERWSESQKTQKAGAYLATIILLGGILEGMLMCRILKEPSEAMTSICVPIDNITGAKKPITQWMLNTMINVCKDKGWIDSDISKFSHEVMQYRNLVHPYHQFTTGLPTPTINTCDISRTVVESALRNIINA